MSASGNHCGESIIPSISNIFISFDFSIALHPPSNEGLSFPEGLLFLGFLKFLSRLHISRLGMTIGPPPKGPSRNPHGSPPCPLLFLSHPPEAAPQLAEPLLSIVPVVHPAFPSPVPRCASCPASALGAQKLRHTFTPNGEIHQSEVPKVLVWLGTTNCASQWLLGGL